ncbi:hypothetical protein B0T22DRAFT_444541 [Podospora appendiculata]|uniref:Uncharacterized protein n=1 Tax=Podospora appendiculata TaxID=314037 RepID=A0AAE0X123_9PEZI|nr:hypothetical protein B0T22DRAFT_444541 [Podospora appendiculata]
MHGTYAKWLSNDLIQRGPPGANFSLPSPNVFQKRHRQKRTVEPTARPLLTTEANMQFVSLTGFTATGLPPAATSQRPRLSQEPEPPYFSFQDEFLKASQFSVWPDADEAQEGQQQDRAAVLANPLLSTTPWPLPDLPALEDSRQVAEMAVETTKAYEATHGSLVTLWKELHEFQHKRREFLAVFDPASVPAMLAGHAEHQAHRVFCMKRLLAARGMVRQWSLRGGVKSGSELEWPYTRETSGEQFAGWNGGR